MATIDGCTAAACCGCSRPRVDSAGSGLERIGGPLPGVSRRGCLLVRLQCSPVVSTLRGQDHPHLQHGSEAVQGIDLGAYVTVE